MISDQSQRRPRVIGDSRYIVIAACCNTPGSTNDRLAYKEAKFDELVENLPDDFYVLGGMRRTGRLTKCSCRTQGATSTLIRTRSTSSSRKDACA